MTDTNELQRIADSVVKRAQEIVAATQWSGDMRVNMTTIIGAGRVLAKRLEEVRAENAALRELVDELANTGAKSVGMVGESGLGRTITQGLAFRTLEDAHAFSAALVKLGKYYQAKETK